MDLPPGSKPLGYKWIFKRKLKPDGSIDKYNGRLVVKGDKQKEGMDYFDTYSPVTRITSIRMLIAIAALHNLEIHQMDVKTTFFLLHWVGSIRKINKYYYYYYFFLYSPKISYTY